jgi:hypothetical protein
MARDDRNVKSDPAGAKRGLVRDCLDFIDNHPRLGWYIALLATLNFGLNVLDLFHNF